MRSAAEDVATIWVLTKSGPHKKVGPVGKPGEWWGRQNTLFVLDIGAAQRNAAAVYLPDDDGFIVSL